MYLDFTRNMVCAVRARRGERFSYHLGFYVFTLLQHEPGLLPTTQRPKEIGIWMKCGRKGSVHPVDPTTFPNTVKSWWRSMQPGERGTQGQERPSETIPLTSWATLSKSGRNSFFLIVLCLFWWRHAIDDSQEGVSQDSAHRDWEKVLDDVLWVLCMMITCGSGHSSAENPGPETTPSCQHATPSTPHSSGPRRTRTTTQKRLIDGESSLNGGRSKRQRR